MGQRILLVDDHRVRPETIGVTIAAGLTAVQSWRFNGW